MIKTYLVKMDEEYRCRCYAAIDRECLASKDGIDCPARGSLKKRPEWCPIAEHSIGECHIQYKEESNRGEINANTEEELLEQVAKVVQLVREEEKEKEREKGIKLDQEDAPIYQFKGLRYKKILVRLWWFPFIKEEKFVAIGWATGNEPQLYPCPHPNEIKSKVAIKLWFDSNLDAKHFLAGWLDGGGEQVCGFYTEHEESDDWTAGLPKWLKLVRSEEEK